MSAERSLEDAGTSGKPEGASAPAASRVALRADVVVIGAGQAGLSSAYHLKKRGLEPGRGFVVLDGSPRAGGAWQFRWPSLKLSTVNGTYTPPGSPRPGPGATAAARGAGPRGPAAPGRSAGPR